MMEDSVDHAPRVAASTPHQVVDGGSPGSPGKPTVETDGGLAKLVDVTDQVDAADKTGAAGEAVVAGSVSGSWRLTHVKALPALLWSLFSALVLAVVLFALLSIVAVVADKAGVIAAVNSLMGEAMQLSVGLLLKLSGLASVVLGLAVAAFKFAKLMLLNAGAMLLEPLEVTLERAGK